ncbi:PEP-CTERM sorting domain-containing protein [Desulforhopalus sp. 52FAK]
MKKIGLLLTGLFLIGTAGNAMALLTLDGYSPDGTNTFFDRIDTKAASDGYDGSYFGYTGADWSGYYLGTVAGNDNKLLEGTIRHYLDDTTYSANLDKIENKVGGETSSDFSVTYSSDYKTGTWATTNPLTDAVQFYVIKGSDEWALYYLDPAQTDGKWTTEHLTNGGGNIPEISHISVSLTEPVNPVPEPTTMLLFGTGLLGLAGFSRRKKQK